jgi:hypothetical protein
MMAGTSLAEFLPDDIPPGHVPVRAVP